MQGASNFLYIHQPLVHYNTESRISVSVEGKFGERTDAKTISADNGMSVVYLLSSRTVHFGAQGPMCVKTLYQVNFASLHLVSASQHTKTSPF